MLLRTGVPSDGLALELRDKLKIVTCGQPRALFFFFFFT